MGALSFVARLGERTRELSEEGFLPFFSARRAAFFSVHFVIHSKPLRKESIKKTVANKSLLPDSENISTQKPFKIIWKDSLYGITGFQTDT